MSDCYLNIKTIATDNIQLLRELSQLMAQISADAFSANNETLQSGSIGAHVRHIIEHYSSLMMGVGSLTSDGLINYDNRPRNRELENSPTNAIQEIDQVCIQLENLTQELSLVVVCSTNTYSEPSAAKSSLSRELSFLHSHTTHHMAIIRLLTLHTGLAVSPEFGKAASTKKFEQNV